MNTKLTLRMDVEQVRTAKAEAARRGKSVSKMVGEFFDALAAGAQPRSELPPVTASLVGILKDGDITKSDYHDHLRKKHS